MVQGTRSVDQKRGGRIPGATWKDLREMSRCPGTVPVSASFFSVQRRYIQPRLVHVCGTWGWESGVLGRYF